MRNSLAATVAFALFAVFVLIVPLPATGRAMRIALDLLHAPLFALLSVAVFRIVHGRTSLTTIQALLTCGVSIIGLGMAVECVQPYLGRHASWQDVWANTCGVFGGMLWSYSRAIKPPGRRAGAVIACCLALLFAVARPAGELIDTVIQRLEMPQVASFERRAELSRWSWRECEVERVPEKATHGLWTLRVDLHRGTYPGVVLIDPVPDWSRFHELTIDVHLTDGPPLDLVIKINDTRHNGEYSDRFHQTARLRPGENAIRVALSEVTNAPQDRKLDLRQIAALSLFTVSPQAPRSFYLDNVRLQ